MDRDAYLRPYLDESEAAREMRNDLEGLQHITGGLSVKAVPSERMRDWSQFHGYASPDVDWDDLPWLELRIMLASSKSFCTISAEFLEILSINSA